MNGKPLYRRQAPLVLYQVEHRAANNMWVIVGPGIEWTYSDNHEATDALCAVLNHCALMGWQECQTLMMTTSVCVN